MSRQRHRLLGSSCQVAVLSAISSTHRRYGSGARRCTSAGLLRHQILSPKRTTTYGCESRGTGPWLIVDAPLVARRRRPGQLTDTSQIERITRNVLTVISRAAEQMGEFVTPTEIRRRLLDLHLNLGVICLRTNRNAEARELLWRSIRGQPDAWPPYLLFLLAFGPAGLYCGLEQFNRRLRRMRRSSGASQ